MKAQFWEWAETMKPHKGYDDISEDQKPKTIMNVNFALHDYSDLNKQVKLV